MYLIKVNITNAEIAKAKLADHLTYLAKKRDEGLFLLYGPYEPYNGGGLTIAQASSREDLDKAIQEDPYFIAQCAQYDVQGFIVAEISENITTFKNK